MIVQTLSVSGQGDIERKKYNYHKREVPSYKRANQCDLVLLTEVGISMKKNKNNEKDTYDFDYEWSSRHFSQKNLSL